MPPRGHLEIFGVVRTGVGATGLYWEEARMLPNILGCTGQPQHQKNVPSPSNVNEKPCTREKSLQLCLQVMFLAAVLTVSCNGDGTREASHCVLLLFSLALFLPATLWGSQVGDEFDHQIRMSRTRQSPRSRVPTSWPECRHY